MHTNSIRAPGHHWWDALHLPRCLCKAMLVLSLLGQLIAIPVLKYRQIVADKSRPERADLFRCFPRYCLFSIAAVYFAVGIIRLLSVIFMNHPSISPIPFLDWWWTGFAKWIHGWLLQHQMPRTLLKRGRLLLKKLISAIFLAGILICACSCFGRSIHLG